MRYVRIISIAALFLSACSDDGTPPADTQVTDKGVDAAVDGPTVDGSAPSPREYVVSSMVVPTSQADTEKYGHDYDNDQQPDNALGAILTALSAAVTSLDLQGTMNQNLYNGKVVMLMRLAAKDFATDPGATLQAWTGEEATCCGALPCSEADAKATCFSGSHSFKVAATSAQNAVLSGAISGGVAELGPGEIDVLLPIGFYPTRVTLKQARLWATIDASGLLNGKVTGVVTKTDLDTKVIPAVAQVLDGELNQTGQSQQVKDLIKNLFDTNDDDTIDASEVADNGLIKVLLAGDVDVDNDGTQELSAGVGFTAVGCTVVP